MMAIAYILWCGICWTLRGGWFGALVRGAGLPEPGTTITRVACAGLMVAPLVFFSFWLLLIWPFLYLAMTIGYFDDAMGLQQPLRDELFMALWGVTVCVVTIAPLWGRVSLFDDPASLVVAIDLGVAWHAISGIGAALAYMLNKPFGRRFGTDWTERAEYLTGCTVGTAILGGVFAWL